MKRSMFVLLALCLLLSGCTVPGGTEKPYTATFLDLFDTVTTVIGYGEQEADFQEQARMIHDELKNYHELFDIYQNYDGVNNAKTINDQAGIAPVQVDPALIDLLLDCRDYYDMTDGKVNVAMGSVLRLWHDAREQGLEDPEQAALPQQEALTAAAEHISFDSIVIDEEAGTVFITDPVTRLDLGAVAKGWAVQSVAEKAPAGMLISVGGNVCATGPKKADGTPWVIGIQDPERENENLHTMRLVQGSVVTSGDYQRTYTVDGKQYHHIIDPQTQMPATRWKSVSVMCNDSGLADALSTGLFLMDLEQGKALAQRYDAEVLWIDKTGEEFMTDGFRSKL